MLIQSEHSRWELEKEIKENKFKGCIISNPVYHKLITLILVINDVKLHRINYGAGVVKLMPNNLNVCGYCAGKGVIK